MYSPEESKNNEGGRGGEQRTPTKEFASPEPGGKVWKNVGESLKEQQPTEIQEPVHTTFTSYHARRPRVHFKNELCSVWTGGRLLIMLRLSKRSSLIACFITNQASVQSDYVYIFIFR